jgi:hypothetical protein
VSRSNDAAACCACIAAADLGALADLRRDGAVRVVADDRRAWVVWPGSNPALLLRLLALPGSRLYQRRDGLWFAHGCILPSFEPPVDRDEGVSLARALVPEPLRPSSTAPAAPEPARLALVLDDHPRDAVALRCPLGVLAAWAETATSAQLDKLRAATAAGEAWVVGTPLPPVRGGVRYWGNDVLVPLGLRPDPALADCALRSALGIGAGSLLVLETDGFDTIPRAALTAVTRAGVRLAWEQEAPPV